MNRDILEKAAYTAGGLFIGAGVMYLAMHKMIGQKYRDIAEEEIQSVKDSYNLLHKKGEYSDPKKAFDAMKSKVESIESYEGMLDENGYFKDELMDSDEDKTEVIVEEKKLTRYMEDGRKAPDEVVKDISDDRDDPPRYEGTDTPYIITVDEFMQDRDDHDKITVSYYEADATLASEDETIVHDHIPTVGTDFVNYVGWKSASDHVVYVRNERLSADFEVLVYEKSYEEEVLGILPDDHPKKKMLQMRNDE